MVPTIGRTVHIVLPEGHPNKGGHRAATVTAAYSDGTGSVPDNARVDLTVFLMTNEPVGAAFNGTPGFLFIENIPCDPTAKLNGSWHEPERAEVPKTAPKEKAA